MWNFKYKVIFLTRLRPLLDLFLILLLNLFDLLSSLINIGYVLLAICF